MFQPMLKSIKKSKPIIINSFGGLNRREAIGDNEFSDMYGVSGRKHPYISSSEKRKVKISDANIKNISNIYSPDFDESDFDISNFCGVADGKFYYNGSEIFTLKTSPDIYPPFNDVEKYPEINSYSYTGKSAISYFNGSYWFYPDNRRFDPLDTSADATKFFYSSVFTNDVIVKNSFNDSRDSCSLTIYHKEYKSIKEGEGGAKLFLCDSTQKLFEGDVITFNHIYTDDSGNTKSLCVYDDSNPYMKSALNNLCKSEFDYDGYNYPVRCVVDKIYTHTKTEEASGDEIVRAYGIKVSLYDVRGHRTMFDIGNPSSGGNVKSVNLSGFTVSKYVPFLSYCTEYMGRLFGLDYYGGKIYASKFGDASCWSEYDTGADASWYIDIPSDGKWTGICSFNSYLYCFKEDLIYVLYGDSPSNFTIVKVINHGCIASDSITVFGNAIYYLSHDGFYMLNSYQPIKISDNLNRKYTNAVCCGFDGLLYFSCKYDDGCELLTYDIDKGLWFRDESLEIVSFCVHQSMLYGATRDKVYVFGEGSYPDEWYVVSKKFDDSSSALRSLCTLLFRLNIPGGSDACVYISYDGGELIKCGDVIRGKLTNFDNSLYSLDGIEEGTLHKASESYYQKFPVRFRCASSYQYKLVCHGDVTLESLERTVSINGSYQR